MSEINRRTFIKTTAAVAAVGPFIKTSATTRSPNGTINVAVVGIRGRGQSHYTNFAKIPNGRVAAL